LAPAFLFAASLEISAEENLRSGELCVAGKAREFSHCYSLLAGQDRPRHSAANCGNPILVNYVNKNARAMEERDNRENILPVTPQNREQVARNCRVGLGGRGE
jgi:hypothetical protein